MGWRFISRGEKAMKDEEAVKHNLLDAGCREQTAGFVQQLFLAGRLSDALHEMKAFRCDLMEVLHQSQRRVDCLDYLIRQTEKEIRVKQDQ
jgi:hypothetical protein